MEAKYKRRLLKLADLLIADARRKKGVKFNLNVWAAPDGPYVHAFTGFASARREVPVSCETHACAVGLACISGAFKRQGLTFFYRREKDWNGDACVWGWKYILTPRYGSVRGWRGVLKFFGLSNGDAEDLFLSSHYEVSEGATAERTVAKRIRAFVAGKEGWNLIGGNPHHEYAG